MSSPSKNVLYEPDLISVYTDELIFAIPVNEIGSDFNQTKSIIYKIAKEFHITSQMIIDKETELFIAVRFPDLGLIIETSRRNGLMLKIAFKGKFFTVGTEEEQIVKIREIITRASMFANSFPVLVKCDIRADVANLKVSEWNYKDYQFGFRAKIYGHIESQKPDEVNTWYLTSTKWQICIYDKLLENKKQKNQEKKEYYSELYRDYKEVARIEVRLRSEIAKQYTTAFLETNSLEKLSRKVIAEFASKRRIYNRKNEKLVSKRNQAKLLTEWEVWKDIRTQDKEYKIKLNKGLKIKHQYSNLKNVKRQLIETNFKNQNSMTKKELIKFIEDNYDEIQNKTKQRLIEKENHEKEVEALKEKLQSLKADSTNK